MGPWLPSYLGQQHFVGVLLVLCCCLHGSSGKEIWGHQLSGLSGLTRLTGQLHLLRWQVIVLPPKCGPAVIVEKAAAIDSA